MASKNTLKITAPVALTGGQKAAATKLAQKMALLNMTPGQKAAHTKKVNGLDLSAVAFKAVATRNANIAAAAAEAAKAERANKRAMRKAA